MRWGVAVLCCLSLAGCAGLEPDLRGTRWELMELNGEDFTPPAGEPRFHLQLQRTGGMTAYAGCNALHGDYQHRGDRLRIGPFAEIRRQCPPEVMARERRVVKAMEGASRHRIEAGVLSLLNPIDTVLARYRAAPEKAPAAP